MVKALLPFAVYDGFSSRTINTGFAEADSGTAWRTTSSSVAEPFRVDGTGGFGVISGSATRNHKTPDVTFLNVANVKSQGVVFAFNPTSYGSYTDFGPVLLRQDANRYLALRIQAGYGTVSIWRRSPADTNSPIQRVFLSAGDTNKDPASDNSYYRYSFQKNKWYWCRMEYEHQSRRVRFRIWTDGEDEPGDWAMNVNVTDYVAWSTGVPGFMSFDTTTFSVSVRTFYYYTKLDNTFLNGATVDSFASYPITDSFDRKSVDGLGAVAGSDLVWYGSTIDSPMVKGGDRFGAVGYDSKGRQCGILDFSQRYVTNGGYWGFLGNTVSGNMEVMTQFSTDSDDGKTFLRVGVRGKEGLVTGAVAGVGYAVQVRAKGTSSTLSLVKHTNYGDTDWTELKGTSTTTQTTTITATITPKTIYNVRLQLEQGSQAQWAVRARVWKQSDDEPTSWHLLACNDAAQSGGALTLTSGAIFVNTQTLETITVDNTHVFYLYEMTAKPALSAGTAPSNLEFLDDVQLKAVTSSSAKLIFKYKGTANDITFGIGVGKGYSVDDSPDISAVTSTLTTTAPDKNGVIQVTVTLQGLPANANLLATLTLWTSFDVALSKVFAFRTAFDGLFLFTELVSNVTNSGFDLTVPFDVSTDFATATKNSAANVRVYAENAQNSVTIPMTLFNGTGTTITGPQFNCRVQNLKPDTTYYYELVLVDPDNGSIPVRYGTVKTEGEQPELYYYDPLLKKKTFPIQIEPQLTSARVTIHYRWDQYNRVDFRVSYRQLGLMGSMWETAANPYKRAETDGDKSWTLMLFGLQPGQSYDVRVDITHPYGVKDDQTSISTTFTTLSSGDLTAKRPKHYLFKVYSNRDRSFLGTFDDVTQPEFAFHENGGVSDMTLRLPRAVSQMDDDVLDFGNRVDCWVIDHTSNGIGPNLLLDEDMNLGAWSFSGDSRWTVDPRGGPDGSAALKATVPEREGGYAAFSDYITLSNPLVAADANQKRYVITLGVSALFEEFEDEFARKQVNVDNIARNFRQQIRQLFPGTDQRSLHRQLDPQVDKLLGAGGLLRRAGKDFNFSLISSVEFEVKTATYLDAIEIKENAEKIGVIAIIREKMEFESVPYVLRLAARASKGQITAQVEYFDIDSPFGYTTAVSEESVSTVGQEWQVLKMIFTPPIGTRQMRVRLTTQGDTTGWVDKVEVRPQELLIYRGTIETVRGDVGPDGEYIEVEVLGLVSKLTDFYVRFAQWVDRQPKRDQPRLVDPYMFDSDDPPPTYVSVGATKVKPRELMTAGKKQSAIVFPEIEASHVIVRVYYDGDANASSSCVLYYSRFLQATFPGAEENVVTSFNKGEYIFYGRTQATYLLENVNDGDSKVSGSSVTTDDKLQVTAADSGKHTVDAGGWTWYHVKHLESGKSGWIVGEYCKQGRNSNTYLWNKVSSRGRSTGKATTGELLKPYNFSLTENTPDSKEDDDYSPSASVDKRYFEFKVNIDGLNRTRNYQFVAKFSDSDGVINNNNQEVANANVINTTPRVLYPELTTTGTLLGLQSNRLDAEERNYDPPTDPALMLRQLVGMAREEDPKFFINFDDSSIKTTSTIAQYTFRDMQLRNALDKIRELCPPGWHWFVDATGTIHLRGPQHTQTHRLRIGEEALKYNIERNIKNVKNVVLVRGRQDEDASEPDGAGSITAEARNEQSIADYGARILYVRDSNVKDTQTAQIMANGRLEELSRPEEQGSMVVIDEKELNVIMSPIKGYNVESFQPGDYVIIEDGDRQSERAYWDRSVFNQANWDAGDRTFIDTGIPIKSIAYRGDHVELTLSQRPPSATGDFAKLVRWQQVQENSTKE